MSDSVGGAPRWIRVALCFLVPLTFLMTACEESNDLVVRVGTAVLIVADSDLTSQSTIEPELRIQAAEWTFDSVTLLLDDDPTERDLKFSEDCTFTDTAFSISVSQSKCAAGIVLGAGDAPIDVLVNATFRLTVRRGKPKQVAPTLDEDGDGIANAADICPFVINPGQEDDDSNGIGDACQVGNLPDTDGDGWADGADNCLWDTNPDQADTQGPGADNIRDAIGDACIEQVATVRDRDTGSDTITVQFDAGSIDDLANTVRFLVLDFQSRETLDCDWDAGVCEMDTSRLAACINRDGTMRCN